MMNNPKLLLLLLATLAAAPARADFSFNGIAEYLSGGSRNTASTSPNIGAGYGGSPTTPYGATSAGYGSTVGYTPISAEASASDCGELQTRVGDTARGQIAEIMPSDGPGNATEEKGGLAVLNIPTGADIFADSIVIVLQQVLIDTVSDTGQKYLNNQMKSFANDSGNKYIGLPELSKQIVTPVTAPKK